jgi:hypothetical protein
MEEARDGVATLAGNPEVAGASVKDNLEGLRGGTEGDLGVVLCVHEVRERNVMATVEQVLLRPEQVISPGAGPHLATSTARAEEGELLVRELSAVLVCEVGRLEYMARGNGRELLQFKLVYASRGERKE